MWGSDEFLPTSVIRELDERLPIGLAVAIAEEFVNLKLVLHGFVGTKHLVPL